MHDPREHFALANRHVVEADERIAGQRQRIERLRQAGHDTAASEDLLFILLETRNLMLAHQELLERDMAKWRTLHPEHKPLLLGTDILLLPRSCSIGQAIVSCVPTRRRNWPFGSGPVL